MSVPSASVIESYDSSDEGTAAEERVTCPYCGGHGRFSYSFTWLPDGGCKIEYQLCHWCKGLGTVLRSVTYPYQIRSEPGTSSEDTFAEAMMMKELEAGDASAP